MQHLLIGRGKVGWHSDGVSHGNKCSSSGGTLEGYLSEAEDGTPIYDAMQADACAFASFVIKGPLMDPALEAGTIRRFNSNDKSCLLGMLPGLQGGFAAMAVMALTDISSLDYVSTSVYLQMLREQVPGVQVGRVINHQIVWDE